MGSLLRKANEVIDQYGSVENYLKAMEIEGFLRPMVTIPELKKEEIPHFPDPEVIEEPRIFDPKKNDLRKNIGSIYLVKSWDIELHFPAPRIEIIKSDI